MRAGAVAWYGSGMSVVNLTGDAAVPVTLSDTVNDPNGPFIALMVWVAGTVSFIDASGNASGVSGTLPAGATIDVKCVRVKATGTTATVLGIKGVC